MKSLLQFREQNARAHKASRVLPISFLRVAALVVSCHGLIAAEGPVSAVQDALRKEQFLTGEPTGVLDEATRSALRRFQLRYGLPVTGEIDATTLQALQRQAVAAPSSPPPPPGKAQGSGPAPATVEKDREFLQRVETGREQVPSATSARSVPTPPVAANPAKNENLTSTPEGQKSRTVEVPRPIATRTVESAPLAQSDDSPSRRETEVVPNAPQRRTKPRNSPAGTQIEETDDDPDPLGPHGVRILRSTTTVTGPDGRTHIYEKTTTASAVTPGPVTRPSEPAPPWPKARGFFRRIFGGD